MLLVSAFLNIASHTMSVVLAVSSEACSVYCFSSMLYKGVPHKAVNARRDMLSQLQRNYDSKDTGFLAMPLLSTSRACRTNGINSVLGKKRLTLDSMNSKVSPLPFYGCGPEALKGHRRACNSRRVHLGSLFGSKKSWMIIIMLFGPLDSDRDCMA
jgi:hypothetical protein